MITESDFGDLARVERWIERRGIQFVSGVPCSWLAPLIHSLQLRSNITYMPAVNEALAVGHAAGAALAGKNAMVLCQNSGVGYLVNPVTSLLKPYGLACDFVVSNRAGNADEPQHAEMERASETILNAIGVRTMWLDRVDLSASSDDRMVALIIKRRLEWPENLRAIDTSKQLGRTPTDVGDRVTYLGILMSFRRTDDLIVTSTGYISRDAFHAQDSSSNFYMLGSMGCAAAIGLSLAVHSAKRVYILDGDGSVLMHLGEMASIANNGCSNICHVIFNNGIYESTGGQATSAKFGFASDTALALGYRAASLVHNPSELHVALERFRDGGGPQLIECITSSGSQSPRVALHPSKVAQRFQGALADTK